MILLMMLFFFGDLKLTYIISGNGVLSKIILVSIPIILIGFVLVFFGGFLAFLVPRFDFSYPWGLLKSCFCFYIDNFFHHFFPQI